MTVTRGEQGAGAPRLSGIVAFLPTGYPDPDTFLEVVDAVFAAGAGAIELGIALSPPTLDGPRVVAAFEEVTINLDEQVALIEAAAWRGRVIAVVFASEATTEQLDELLGRLAAAGVWALFVPDLTMERQLEVMEQAPLPLGLFVTAHRDLPMITEHGGRRPAFVYLRSSPRATGEPLDREAAAERLADTREALAGEVPLLVGFGVAEPGQVAELHAGGADGVVVGSLIVETVQDGAEAVGAQVRRLNAGMVG